jgi:hypothetical protein
MAIIYTYPRKNSPVVEDILLISDTQSEKNGVKTLETKTTTIGDLKDAIDVVDKLNATAPLEVDVQTGDVTVSLTGITGFGTAGQILKVNSGGNGLEWATDAGGDSYDLNAGIKDGTKIPLKLTSGSGTDDSVVNLVEGTNITLTQVDSTNIKIDSLGGAGKNTIKNQTGPTGTPTSLAGEYNKFNFVNYDPNDLRVFAQEDPNDSDQVNIFFPPPASPTYPPYFNQTGAVVADPLSSFRKSLIVSDPDGTSSGNFKTGGWDDLNVHSSYLLSNAETPQFKPGNSVYILGFSPAGAPVPTGCKVQVKVFDADGSTELRNETTGVLDQNTSFSQNEIDITVSNYVAIVDPYGEPTQYQAKLNITVKIKAILTSASLSGGRYSVQIIFTPDQVLPKPGTGNPGTPQAAITYNLSSVFADADPTSPDASGVTFVDANIKTETNSYLSGVKYLTSGSKFGVEAGGIQGINGNTQGKNGTASNNLAYSALANLNTNSVSDKAWAPTTGTVTGYNDVWDNKGVEYDYNDFTIQSSAFTYRGAAGSSTLTISDPWNNSSKASASNLDVLVLTPGSSNSSASGAEYFDHEDFRLSKANLTSNYVAWNSQTALTTSAFGTKPSAASNTDFQDACQIVDAFNSTGAKLISADKFYLSNNTTTLSFSGYLPTQSTNFSSFNKQSVYHRKFSSSNSSIPSFTLTFTGSNWGSGNSNVNDALDDQSIKIYIRRVASASGGSFGPATAVPLNLHNWNSTPSNPTKYWDPGVFSDGGSGIDTQSATIRTSTSSGNAVTATFGNWQTDQGMYIEIQYLDANIKINSVLCAFN